MAFNEHEERFGLEINELGYTEHETSLLLSTLQRLRRHLTVPTLVVGGLANRIQFPKYARAVPPVSRKYEELDVLLPARPDPEIAVLLPTALKDFAVTHILPQADAHYFCMIDRSNRTKVDLFVPERLERWHTISFRGKQIATPIREEAYLKVMRDLYRFLSTGRQLEPKHARFFPFADEVVNWDLVEKLWPTEQPLVDQQGVPFRTYRSVVLDLINTRADLLVPRASSRPQYPADPPTVHGVSVVPEVEWREVMGANE